MVAPAIFAVAGVGILGFIAYYLFINRKPDIDEVTGETPGMKGALRNTQDFFLGDGSSAPGNNIDTVTGEDPRKKGAVRNTADFLFGDGATQFAQHGLDLSVLDTGNQIDSRTGETRNQKGFFRNSFDFFFGDGTSAITARGISNALTSKPKPKATTSFRNFRRNNFGGRQRG